MSDEISGRGRPASSIRLLSWLLVVMAGAHAAAAVSGALPGGWGTVSMVADAALAAVVLAGVITTVLSPSAVPPLAVEVAAVLAICLAGLVSGLRAAQSWEPWAGGDVVLAVLAAVALSSRAGFTIAVGGAQASWAVVLLAGAISDDGRLSAGQWVLVGVVVTTPTAAAFALRGALERLGCEVETAHRTTEQQAVTDPLTGVTNRRGLELMALPMIEHARRQGEATHCLFIDLDGFRVVNDTLGRGLGDEVLGAVCEAVLASVRATDVVARWAGDQFVVIGPGTGTSPLEMERRVRGHLTDSPPVPQHVWDGRVSIGSATLVPWDEGNVDSLLRRAEEDMQLRRSLRRQSRARALAAPLIGTDPAWTERRSNPPKPPPASPTVPGEH